MNCIEPLKVAEVRRAGDDTARFLLKLWERGKGRDTIDLVPLSPYFMRFSGRLEEGLTPPVLSMGPHTLAARLIGPHLCTLPKPDLDIALGEEYRRFASCIYHDALENHEPKYDLVSSVFSTEGLSYDVLYSRLVLPIHNRIGIRQAILYTQAHHVRPIHRRPDQEGRPVDFQPTTDPEQRFLAPGAVST